MLVIGRRHSEEIIIQCGLQTIRIKCLSNSARIGIDAAPEVIAIRAELLECIDDMRVRGKTPSVKQDDAACDG